MAKPVIPINDISETSRYSDEEKQARCKLASTYRLVDRMGWSQQVANHISFKVPGNKEHFLINPFGLFYSEVTAGSLVKLDLNGRIIDPGSTELGVQLTGFVIHSAIHSARPDIKCIMHVHTSVGGAVSAMKCGLLPLSLEAASIGDVSYHDYQGISVDEKERADLATDLGPVNKVMILRNHGLLAMGCTIEETFDRLLNLMQACETQVKAMSAGIDKLVLISDDVVKKTYETDPTIYGPTGHTYDEINFEAFMRELDREGYNTGYYYKLASFAKKN